MAGLGALARLLRPRTLARALKSVDDLIAASRELKRGVRQLEKAGEKVEQRTAALEQSMRALKQDVAELSMRESRLRAIYQRDTELRDDLEQVGAVLDAAAVQAHAARAIGAAPLHLEPFPHAVIENLLPDPVYEAVLRGIPPVELFDGATNKQRIVVPFEIAPLFSRRVWDFLLETVVDGAIGPALERKFRKPLAEWLEATWPELRDTPLESLLTLHSTEGRILLRRRGYLISPHRDPKWGFLTCLMYLARPGDSTSWGTQLFAVDGDGEAAGVAPHWIRPEQCRLMKEIPFRRNTALVFLNSEGAHGARIPADAEPPDLERYVYQFRIGPTSPSIRRLMALLPEDRRGGWSGKVADYV